MKNINPKSCPKLADNSRPEIKPVRHVPSRDELRRAIEKSLQKNQEALKILAKR